MKMIKRTFALAFMTLLTACGGDGYYEQDKTPPVTETPDESTTSADPQVTLAALKKEGKYLFGQNDLKSMGYIDHALDTYTQGILKLTQDLRSIDLSNQTNKRKTRCFSSPMDTRACYVFKGEEIKALLGDQYATWDFDISTEDVSNIRLKTADITPTIEDYVGQTTIYIFENENPQKNLQDISITGSFSYPLNLSTSLQKRFILINAETSDFNLPGADGNESAGALSIYKVPEMNELYVTEAGSGFNTLINDNTNVSFAEPVNFRINSILGVAPSTYQIDQNAIQSLNLPDVQIEGTRVEHTPPTLNDQKFIGKIYLEGKNIFNFKDSGNDSTLKFNHTFNTVNYRGQSTIKNNQVETRLDAPNNLRY